MHLSAEPSVTGPATELLWRESLQESIRTISPSLAGACGGWPKCAARHSQPEVN